jgi:hypothetical protein
MDKKLLATEIMLIFVFVRKKVETNFRRMATNNF